jgi:hypothetical protein
MRTRREFIKQVALGSTVLSVPSILSFAKANGLPVRALTEGPKFHWFGYYDKKQFNKSNTKVLGMEVDFEMRSPTRDDVIKMGYIDLEDNDKWIEIGESRAWGWQQGCMLQWVPGSDNKVIWNDRKGTEFVSILKDVETGEERIIDKAIYTLSPDGKFAVGTDFARIQNYRKGYGYPGGVDPYKRQNAPRKSGIYKIDLESGKSTLIISYNDISKIPNNGEDISMKWHYFNHLLISPDSKRFIFLNRYWDAPIPDEVLNNVEEYNKIRSNYTTRMFTAGVDGKDVYLLDPSGKTSHFIWKDPNRITAWTRPVGMKQGFYEFEDRKSNIRRVGEGVMKVNGHNTFLPGTNNEWILNDTYPQGEARKQVPYLYHEKTNKRIDLGRFHEPIAYKGEWRCDLHPRYSNDGKMICIDSTHGGNGRQIYLIDISELKL